VAAYCNVPNTHYVAEEVPVEAEIQISQGDDVTEFAALREWLRGERALTGLVRAARRQPGETELGAAFDLLTVALGSGGVGVVLAKSLVTWLPTRRPTIAITVTTAKGSVTVTGPELKDSAVMTLLLEVLRANDEP
jgi:Effector Associated Constant Component 1